MCVDTCSHYGCTHVARQTVDRNKLIVEAPLATRFVFTPSHPQSTQTHLVLSAGRWWGCKAHSLVLLTSPHGCQTKDKYKFLGNMTQIFKQWRVVEFLTQNSHLKAVVLDLQFKMCQVSKRVAEANSLTTSCKPIYENCGYFLLKNVIVVGLLNQVCYC